MLLIVTNLHVLLFMPVFKRDTLPPLFYCNVCYLKVWQLFLLTVKLKLLTRFHSTVSNKVHTNCRKILHRHGAEQMEVLPT